MKSTPNCYFAYWIGNWYQAWNLDLDTKRNVWHSRGQFTILKIYGYDERLKRL